MSRVKNVIIIYSSDELYIIGKVLFSFWQNVVIVLSNGGIDVIVCECISICNDSDDYFYHSHNIMRLFNCSSVGCYIL